MTPHATSDRRTPAEEFRDAETWLGTPAAQPDEPVSCGFAVNW